MFVVVGGLPQGVFPEAQDAPAGAAQGAVNQTIAGLVAGDFASPEGGVAFWFCAVLGASVPEAAVHEDCKAGLPEHKVRTDGENEDGGSRMEDWKPELEMAAPAGDVVAAEELGQDQLGVLVPARAYPGHHLRPLRLGEDVRHEKTPLVDSNNLSFVHPFKIGNTVISRGFEQVCV